MHKCLLLSSQTPRLSALQNPGHWRKRKKNENNIHFLSNFEKTSDWEAWTLLSTSTSAAVCGYLWDKKEVLWPPVVMQQGGQDIPKRWTRQWSLHSHAPSFLKYRLGRRGRGQTNSGSSLSPNLWFVGFHLQGENSQCNSKLPWGLHHYRVGGSCVVLSWKASQGIHTQSKHTIKLGRTILAHTAGWQKTELLAFWNSYTSSVTEAGPSARHCTWQWIKLNKMILCWTHQDGNMKYENEGLLY